MICNLTPNPFRDLTTFGLCLTSGSTFNSTFTKHKIGALCVASLQDKHDGAGIFFYTAITFTELLTKT